MKSLNSKILTLCVLSLLMLTACSGSGGSSSRKKMPTLTTGGREFSNIRVPESGGYYRENIPVLGLSTSFTSIAYNGGARECIAVTLPQSADEHAIALLGIYKPFASVLISQWAKQATNAIVLDFSNGTDQKRSDYLLQSKDNTDVPVIVLWNEQSSKRVAAYFSQLSDVPGISLKRNNGN